MRSRTSPEFFSAARHCAQDQCSWLRSLMTMLMLGLCAELAWAQPVDGDFELNPFWKAEGPTNDIPGAPAGTWRRFGDVDRINKLGTIVPQSGAWMAILTTDSTSKKPKYGVQAGDRSYLYLYPGMGVPGLNGWMGYEDGEGFWRVQNAPGFNWVSAMKQKGCPFSNGDVVKFRWKFLTQDKKVGPSVSAGDCGMFLIMDRYSPPNMALQTALARVQDSTGNVGWIDSTLNGTGYQWETKWYSHSHTFTKNGNFTLAFAVGDLRGTSSVSALLIDDIRVNSPGITFTPPALTLTENQSGTVQVALTTAPTPGTTVTITLNPDPQLSYAPGVLTFDNSNWSTPKPVVITALDNFIKDGNRVRTINVTAASAPAGPYGAVSDTYDVTIIDDETPGIIVDLSPNGSLTVQEGGATDKYFVSLQSQPLQPVTVMLTSPDNQVTLSPSSLTFDAKNWKIPAQVTVTAIDDNILEGIHTGQILHTAFSLDVNYNFDPKLPDPNLAVLIETTILDNPKVPGGEGSYAGSKGPGLNFGGEGGFGFGTECKIAPETAKKKASVILQLGRNDQGQFVVLNVSILQN